MNSWNEDPDWFEEMFDEFNESLFINDVSRIVLSIKMSWKIDSFGVPHSTQILLS